MHVVTPWQMLLDTSMVSFSNRRPTFDTCGGYCLHLQMFGVWCHCSIAPSDLTTAKKSANSDTSHSF